MLFIDIFELKIKKNAHSTPIPTPIPVIKHFFEDLKLISMNNSVTIIYSINKIDCRHFSIFIIL